MHFKGIPNVKVLRTAEDLLRHSYDAHALKKIQVQAEVSEEALEPLETESAPPTDNQTPTASDSLNELFIPGTDASSLNQSVVPDPVAVVQESPAPPPANKSKYSSKKNRKGQ